VLRALIERYLDNLTDERAFDSTLIALLAGDGFFDIHFSHGPFEFGKDFVAKLVEDGVTYQYAIQSKLGDINLSQWRRVREQMLETVTNNLGGPSFDEALPRRSILVLTGRLKGGAQPDFNEFVTFAESLRADRAVLPPWDRESLVEMMLQSGPERLFNSAADAVTYGRFFRIYADVVDGSVKVNDVEKHFETRLVTAGNVADRIATVGLEAHLLADAARSRGRADVALQIMLSTVRAVAHEIQSAGSGDALLSTLLATASADVGAAATTLADRYLRAASGAGTLRDVVSGIGLFATYPVLCAQLMDALVLRHFFADDLGAPAALAKLVASEPGCTHPISDRYAVSIVWSALVLCTNGYRKESHQLLRECAIWLVDRYWNDGAGLAPSDASEQEELAQLLGGPFSGVEISGAPGSVLACALMDLACFLNDEEVYAGLRADILAADICPRYYQICDTPGQFEYCAPDIVRIPNVQFREHMTQFNTFEHGGHLRGDAEPRLATVLGPRTYIAASLLLRDRYFPKLWPILRA
jgi:hypothetical protein